MSGRYTHDDLDTAVGHVKRGMSIYKASKETNVPKTTIRDHSRGKYVNIDTKWGGQYALNETEETALANYIEYMGQRGFPLTRKVIKKVATDVVKASARPPRINIESGPSHKWVRQFLKRHPQLSLRTPHPLEKDRSLVSQDRVDKFYTLLNETLTRLGIKDDQTKIINFDETGFSGKEHAREKIVLKKGTKHPYQPVASVGGHITLQLAISAAGRVISPLVIFSKNLPKSDFTEGMPEDWSFAFSGSGYINNDLFVSWFQDSFVKQCGRARPILVIMDNLSSHLNKAVIDTAQREHIELLCLPAHSTHLLQPLDVGYYHLLKQNVASLTTSLGYTGMKTIPRHKFPKLLHLALNKIPGSTAAGAFSSVGICPFNPAKVKVTLNDTSVNDITTVTQQPEEDACDKCGQRSKENHLVQLGLIPASLKTILTVPERNEPSKMPLNKRMRYDNARVLTVPDIKASIAGPSTSIDDPGKRCTPNVKVVKSRNSKKKQQCSSRQIVSPISAPLPDPELMDSEVLCEVCMTGTNTLTWIGCDHCDRWVHYECVGSYEERLAIDLSLVTGANWWCNMCRQPSEE